MLLGSSRLELEVVPPSTLLNFPVADFPVVSCISSLGSSLTNGKLLLSYNLGGAYSLSN